MAQNLVRRPNGQLHYGINARYCNRVMGTTQVRYGIGMVRYGGIILEQEHILIPTGPSKTVRRQEQSTRGCHLETMGYPRVFDRSSLVTRPGAIPSRPPSPRDY